MAASVAIDFLIKVLLLVIKYKIQKHLFQSTESGKTHQNALANNLSKINNNLDDLLALVLLIQQQKENKGKEAASDSDSDGSKDED